MQKTQRTMEPSILGIRKKERNRNKEIRPLTKMRDIGKVIKKLKWKHAGHIMRQKGGRWTKKLKSGCPITRNGNVEGQ